MSLVRHACHMWRVIVATCLVFWPSDNLFFRCRYFVAAFVDLHDEAAAARSLSSGTSEDAAAQAATAAAGAVDKLWRCVSLAENPLYLFLLRKFYFLALPLGQLHPLLALNWPMVKVTRCQARSLQAHPRFLQT